MVEKQIFLSPAGAVKTAGYEQPLRLGYAKSRGIYRLTVTASGEWAGLTIRAFWHSGNTGFFTDIRVRNTCIFYKQLDDLLIQFI